MNKNHSIKKAQVICAFFSIFLTAGTSLQAQNVWTEDFDYPISDLLTSHGWEAHSGGTTSPIMVTNGLSFIGYPSSDIGGAAILDADGQDVRKAFPVVESGSMYVSFMAQMFGSDKSSYFVHLWDGDPAQFNYPARVYTNSSAEFGLALADNKKSSYAPSPVYSPGETYLIVIRYDVVAGDNNDLVRMYVCSEIAEEEPPIATIGPLSDPEKADVKPAGFGLRQYSNGQSMVIDGIRVASSWSEAVLGKTSNTDLSETNKQYRILNDANQLAVALDTPLPLALYASSGKLLQSMEGVPGINTLSTNLDSGIYLLKIGTQTIKIRK